MGGMNGGNSPRQCIGDTVAKFSTLIANKKVYSFGAAPVLGP